MSSLEAGLVGGIIDQYVNDAETVDRLLAPCRSPATRTAFRPFFLMGFLTSFGFFSLDENDDQEVCTFASNAIETPVYTAVAADDESLHPLVCQLIST
jgi:hypothetical protein